MDAKSYWKQMDRISQEEKGAQQTAATYRKSTKRIPDCVQSQDEIEEDKSCREVDSPQAAHQEQEQATSPLASTSISKSRRPIGDEFSTAVGDLSLSSPHSSAQVLSFSRNPSVPAEFPTPALLRKANDAFTKRHPHGQHGEILPTSFTKAAVFNAADYADVDKVSLNVPLHLYSRPLKEVVNYLMCYAPTDLHKFRAIYRWLCSQDLNNPQWESDLELRDLSPDMDMTVIECLQMIKSYSSYTEIFDMICRSVGITTVSIHGYVKGVSYDPGDELNSTMTGSWSAVSIDNVWYLVDVHWGASAVDGREHGNWVLIDDNGSTIDLVDKYKGTGNVWYEFVEEWFLLSPEIMIYSHWPSDEKWQLLARPVSKNEFKEMAALRVAFFDYGLEVTDSSKKCLLYAKNGQCEITIQQPEGAKYHFMYRLWMAGKEAYSGPELERFAHLENRNSLMSCKISFPVPGKYRIEFYCRDNATDMYERICSYAILTEHYVEDVELFPENKRVEWGPGPDLEDVGLVPITHPTGIIKCPNGDADIRFQLSEPGCKLPTLVKLRDTDNKVLKNNTNLHYITNEELIILVRLPSVGMYALDLFASDIKKAVHERGSLLNMCTYGIKVISAFPDPNLFPGLENNKVGATDKLRGLGLRPRSHPDAFFEAPPSGTVDVQFDKETSVSCDFQADLERHGAGDEVIPVENMIFIDRKPNRVTFKLRFPQAGHYVANLYGRESHIAGALPSIFTYVIDAQQPMTITNPFPKQLSAWTEDCELVEPAGLRGVLVAKKTLFKVKVPAASSVATIGSGDSWTYFENDGNGVWTGDVNTAQQTDNFKLAAKLDDESYTILLTFVVPGDRETYQTQMSPASRVAPTNFVK